MAETQEAVAPEFVPSAEFLARDKRVSDAVQLKQPDRIPLIMGAGYYLAEMGGFSKQTLYDDFEASQAMLEKAALLYEPDMIFGAWHTPEPSRILGDRMTKWPGLGLDEGGSFQFNEQEFMKAADYDAFIEDPGDWTIRVYTPRAFANCEGLALLPPLGMFAYGYYNVFNYPVLTAPPVVAAFETIYKAAQAQVAWLEESLVSAARLAELGFPPFVMLANICEAPFDFMSDTLRGMRGIFLDMLRIPDKLLAAEEKVGRFQVEHIKNAVQANNIPHVFIPLHRGSDGFMSLAQFEKFYWPQLKEMILAFIDAGITPWVYYEGVWNDRLEYLAELPKGKSVGMFQDSDIFKVKDVVGDTLCILGGMPIPMLKNGTPESVRAYTKRLCEEVGRDGGFIMSTSVLELEGCNPELIEAWTNATHEFGAY
ncbi:MAG: uroporphyrinogen decarboxylase family protein [Candidatus Promineifilaceae bacterium]